MKIVLSVSGLFLVFLYFFDFVFVGTMTVGDLVMVTGLCL